MIGSFQGKAQQQEYILRIGFISEIDSFSPLVGWTEPAWAFYGLVYDYLFSPDQDLNRRPNLARSVEPIDANMSTWRYHLAQNAKWHDGVPFTADDVVFTIKYYKTAEIWFYDPWVSLQGLDIITNVTKVDNHTVDVEFFHGNNASAISQALDFPILPEHWWNTSNNDLGRPIKPLEAQASYPNKYPVGTGGFMAAKYSGQPWQEWGIYDEWQKGETVTLYKNPDYHNGAPQIDGVQFVFYKDMSLMVEALKRGDIDVAWVSPDAYLALQGVPGIGTNAGLFSTSYWVQVGINQNPAATYLNPTRYDWFVRKALAHATNKTYIIERYYKGLAVEGSTLLSPNQPFWHYEPTPEEKFQYNLTLANQILDQAGYYWTGTPGQSIRAAGVGNPYAPQGKKLEYTMLIRVEYPEEYQTALYLTETWAKIGVKLNIYVVDEPTLETKVYGSEVDMFIWYWADPPDPNYLLSIVTSYQLSWDNDNFWWDPKYDELYLKQLQAINKTERQQYVHEAQRMFYNSGVYIIYAYLYETLAWRTDRFKGWPTEWRAGKGSTHCWSYPPFYHDLKPITAPPGLSALLTVSVAVDEEYTFSAEATDTDSTALTFLWDFGDGTKVTDTKTGTPGSLVTSSVVHAYETEGEFTYTVKVSDERNNYDIKSGMVYVGPFNLGPRDVGFKANVFEAYVGDPITFTANASDSEGDTLTFIWDFGDGTTTTETKEASPNEIVSISKVHTYNSSGAYTPKVNISDAGGTEQWHMVSKSLTTPITISTIPPPSLPTQAILIGVALGTVAIAAIAFIVWKRRRPEEEE